MVLGNVVLLSRDPEAVVRCAGALNACADLRLVAVCEDAVKLPAALDLLRPDMLLLDSMAAGATFGLLAAVHTVHPECKVVLWAHALPGVRARLARMLGVRGIAAKFGTLRRLLYCLETVARGSIWLDPTVTEPLRPPAVPGPSAVRRRGKKRPETGLTSIRARLGRL